MTSRPYTLLARFYDLLTPYAPAMNRHARRRILAKILPRVRSVCDLACGTGTTALDFARHGLKVFAVDNSPAMCRLARRKARAAGLPVRVHCSSLIRFRLPEPVDLVTCEFASLNHSQRSDLAPVLRRVAQALRPGGWFLFDVNTSLSFEKQIPSSQWMEGPGFRLILRGTYNRRARKAWLNFEWFVRVGKLWRHSREKIENACWSDTEIRRALRQAGFVRVRVWDGVDVRPPIPGARRGCDSYFLAQKLAR